LHHTTFVKANDNDDPAYSLKPSTTAQISRGKLKGANVHKSAELETDRD